MVDSSLHTQQKTLYEFLQLYSQLVQYQIMMSLSFGNRQKYCVTATHPEAQNYLCI